MDGHARGRNVIWSFQRETVHRASIELQTFFFYSGDWVGAPNGRMLPFIRTTDTLEVQILSYDVLCH